MSARIWVARQVGGDGQAGINAGRAGLKHVASHGIHTVGAGPGAANFGSPVSLFASPGSLVGWHTVEKIVIKYRALLL